MEKKLRVSFIIPFTDMTGGIAVVLEYSRQLTGMGHEVKIYYPLLPYHKFLASMPLWKRFPAWLKRLLTSLRNIRRSIPLFSEDIPVTPVVKIRNAFIGDADAVIATAWPTAYDVNKLSPKKGRKFYFMQDYEAWYGCVKMVDGSYRLPLNIIAIAPWLTGLLMDKFGRDDVTEIRNGIRLDRFYPPAAGKDFGQPSLLLMAHELERKGTKDAIEALAVIKERYPQLTIRMFGMCARPPAPFDFEYHQDPPYEKLLSLYQDAAIFIFSSHSEGWGLTPIEAMACGCALVATNVGCIPVINDGQNMVIAGIKNPSSIADGVLKLLGNRALAESIAAQGLKTVQGMGWENSARAFLNTISAQAAN